MSNDTKRALEIIAPMANELHIQIAADQYYLYCDSQAIGIACNSTYATIMEFVGYLVFLWAADREIKLPKEIDKRIKRYWYSGE